VTHARHSRWGWACIWIAAACCLPVSCLAQNSIEIVSGNVFLQRGAERRQLTREGLDRDAVLSLDGRHIAFVRATPGVLVSTGSGEVEAGEVWTVTADAAPIKVLAGRSAQAMKNVIAGIHDLQFSSDGRYLFFLSSAWATSDAVDRLELATAAERFIASGNVLLVIRDGRYANHLLLSQHRYDRPGAARDGYYVFTFDGVEIGPAPEQEIRRLRAEPGDDASVRRP
jgi:hypothetical protein